MDRLTLQVDTANTIGELQPVSDTLCVWDFRMFDDGAFGIACPDGWFKQTYPFIRQVILMTFTGGKGYNEWYTEDAYGTPLYNFSIPMRVLHNVLRQGIVPLLVVGQTPSALSVKPEDGGDSCGWGNRYRPKDYLKYYNYIYTFAEALVNEFGMETVRQWVFRIGTEPDNKSWWQETEEEYFRLYDYTVAALENVLGHKQVFVFPGNLEKVDSFENLFKHCAQDINFCTGQKGTSCCSFSVSDYSFAPAIDMLPSKIQMMKERINDFPELQIREINIGEGQFISDGTPPCATVPHRLKMAQVGVEHGASWQAALYDISQEYGLRYYANWAYCCDFSRSQEPFIKTPAYHAALAMSRFNGYHLQVTGGGIQENGNRVNAVAALSPDHHVQAVVYNHHDKWKEIPCDVEVQFQNTSWKKVEVTFWCIDHTHNNVFTNWLEVSKDITRIESNADFDVLGSIVETEVFNTLSIEDRAFWIKKKHEYAKQNKCEITQQMIFTAESGCLTVPLHLEGHSVWIMEIIQLDKTV